jgi:hypothetical protein
VGAQGTIEYDTSCPTLYLTKPLTIPAGHTVAVEADTFSVTLSGNNLVRIVDVNGGTVTLSGSDLVLASGSVHPAAAASGTNGADGAIGASGATGSPGVAGGAGGNWTPGAAGANGAASAAGSATDPNSN